MTQSLERSRLKLIALKNELEFYNELESTADGAEAKEKIRADIALRNKKKAELEAAIQAAERQEAERQKREAAERSERRSQATHTLSATTQRIEISHIDLAIEYLNSHSSSPTYKIDPDNTAEESLPALLNTVTKFKHAFEQNETGETTQTLTHNPGRKEDEILRALFTAQFAIDQALNKATDEDKDTDNIHIHISSLNINGSPFTDNSKIQQFAREAGYSSVSFSEGLLKKKNPTKARMLSRRPKTPVLKTKVQEIHDKLKSLKKDSVKEALKAFDSFFTRNPDQIQNFITPSNSPEQQENIKRYLNPHNTHIRSSHGNWEKMCRHYQLLLKLKTLRLRKLRKAELEALQNELKPVDEKTDQSPIDQLTTQQIEEDLERYRQNRIKELETAKAKPRTAPESPHHSNSSLFYSPIYHETLRRLKRSKTSKSTYPEPRHNRI